MVWPAAASSRRGALNGISEPRFGSLPISRRHLNRPTKARPGPETAATPRTIPRIGLQIWFRCVQKCCRTPPGRRRRPWGTMRFGTGSGTLRACPQRSGPASAARPRIGESGNERNWTWRAVDSRGLDRPSPSRSRSCKSTRRTGGRPAGWAGADPLEALRR